MTGAAGEAARPLPKPGVFETLGAAITRMREHPLRLMVPYAIVQVLIIIGHLMVWGLTRDSGGLSTGWGMLYSTGIALIDTVGWALVIVALGVLAKGQLPNLAATFGPVFQRLAPLLGLFILMLLVVIATIVPGCVTAVIAAAAGADDWLIITSSTVVGLPLMLYVMTRLAVAYQAFILDGLGPAGAIGESWTLTADNMLRLFAIVLIAVAAVGSLQVGIWALLGLAGEVARIIVGGVLNTPLTVFGLVAITLYYLRVRETSHLRTRETSRHSETTTGKGW